MKNLFLIYFSFLAVQCLFGQNEKLLYHFEVASCLPGDSSHSEYLFKDCYFIGGEANYSKYLQSNPKIKKLSKKYKIDDFVMIAVRIDSIGTPLKYNFIYSIEDCPKCNKEAMKMIKRIKKWDATDVIDENGKLKKASIVFSVKVPFNSTE